MSFFHIRNPLLLHNNNIFETQLTRDTVAVYVHCTQDSLSSFQGL